MTHEFIKKLSAQNELRVIDEPLDVELEIPHLAYLEVKKGEGGKALLFTNPVDSRRGERYKMPVLMNLFGSFKRTEMILGATPDAIGARLSALLKPTKPSGWREVFSKIREFWNLRAVFPKTTRKRPRWKDSTMSGESVDLFALPILKTWEKDGTSAENGRFITMGQVYTTSLDGKKRNLGMYRLQVFDKNTLGLHWQIHKDANHFYHEYRRAGRRMPVSIALGGDPLYIWCGQAPMPMGFFELMLYGFIRGRRALLSPCNNGICAPSDCDIVIEGYLDPADPAHMKDEGPFGDHTGYYTLVEPYPSMKVTAIHTAKDAVYPATVVGKPPLEDKFMGHATERVFLPLLSATTHGLLDYHMPENGVFHNLIFARVAGDYPGQARQAMHGFWGVGQMSFVKHAIFVGADAPSLTDYNALARHILERFSASCLVFSEGVCDALDHSSPSFAYGGKLGVDATGAVLDSAAASWKDLESLCFPCVDKTRYFEDTRAPILVLAVEKKENMLAQMKNYDFGPFARIVVAVDAHKNDVTNAYMLLWRVVNNIDAARDVAVALPADSGDDGVSSVGGFGGRDGVVLVDATDKNALDNFPRLWPDDVNATASTLESLRQKNLLTGIDSAFLERFRILN